MLAQTKQLQMEQCTTPNHHRAFNHRAWILTNSLVNIAAETHGIRSDQSYATNNMNGHQRKVLIRYHRHSHSACGLLDNKTKHFISLSALILETLSAVYIRIMTFVAQKLCISNCQETNVSTIPEAD